MSQVNVPTLTQWYRIFRRVHHFKHTPGPWESRGKTVYNTEGEGFFICEAVSRPFVHPEREESEANARLIAAAPELLAGCQHALLLLSGLSTDGEITMTPEGKDTIIAELRAYIAKAEGREP